MALQLSPVFGQLGVNGFCFRMHREEARPIIEAVEAYRQDHGEYPASLGALVPGYLDAVPVPPCSSLSPVEEKYELIDCSSGKLLLTTESVNGAQVERYNFETGKWSAISFLDGACSLLGE